jgi:hypothetical protein
LLGLTGIGVSYVIFIIVQVHESIFKIVAMNFRDKIRVVFNEIDEKIWDIFVIFMRDQNIHIGLLLYIFGEIISMITFTALIYMSI